MAQTYEEFRNSYASDHAVWASKALPAAVAAPDKDKVLQGWTIEKPKHNFFNWLQHRTDVRLEELEAKVAWMEACLVEQGTISLK